MIQRRGVVVLVIGALLLGACGSRVDEAILGEHGQSQFGSGPEEAVDSTEVPGPVAPELSPDGGSGSSSADEDPQVVPSQPDPNPSASLAPDPADSEPAPDEMPLVLSVEPACVAHGDAVTVTIETLPRAQLSKAVAYADGQTHGQMGFDDVDGSGVYAWRWTITPDVPPGKAHVLIMVNDQANERRAQGHIEFHVAGPTRECRP